MPPSKVKSSPQYDDRMERVVCSMTEGLCCDVRELMVQKYDMTTAHHTANRPKPDEWYAAYAVDESHAEPPPTNVLVVDDVLTTGAHFAGLKRRLVERFPAVKVRAVFYARVVRQGAEPE